MAAENMPQTNGNNNLLSGVRLEDITLDEPNLEQMRLDRQDRTRLTMNAVDARLTKEVMPKNDDPGTLEEQAAILIQSHYRGHLGRRRYLDRLFERYKKEEAMRLEKTHQQVEEGELLVENHKLQVQFDDDSTTRRNKSRHYITSVITIQRAWRSYRRRKHIGTLSNMSPHICEGSDVSDSDTAGSAQPMSISTPSPGDSEKSITPLDGHTNLCSALSTTKLQHYEICHIEPEQGSIVSDLSEMSNSLKEHQDSVQTFQKEDLEVCNTMQGSQVCTQQNLVQLPDETEEEFVRRVRKMNYLSLAQEFAALKKADSEALPFDLHKTAVRCDITDDDDDTDDAYLTTDCLSSRDVLLEDTGVTCSSRDSPDLGGHTVTGSSVRGTSNQPESHRFEKNQCTKSHIARVRDLKASTKYGSKKQVNGSSVNFIDNNWKKSSPTQDKLDDFDVYNIETTLPQMDWVALEQQLKKAAEEEEKKKQSRRNDREEIRRKLAMGVDEEYYGGERTYKKPNLQTRLQGSMNLQLCYMNDVPDNIQAVPTQEKLSQSQPLCQPQPQENSQDSVAVEKSKGDKEDFFTKQARLQDEARKALEQVRPMAHMQLEVEKQMRKKSPIAEMVGIPGFGDGRKKKLIRPVMADMNFAQLQVVVNDLHTQIEGLNEELMKLLVDRDDLHMEQDSMLVDIEDLTRTYCIEHSGEHKKYH